MATELHNLTRTCVLNGISAVKWESLVLRWKERNPSPTANESGEQIWSALRPLFTTHASEKNLPDYAPRALSSGLLPRHILAVGLLHQPFVAAGSSPAEVSLLTGLVELVLSSLPGADASSVPRLLQVPLEASLEDVLNAVHSAIELVKLAFSLPLPTSDVQPQPSTSSSSPTGSLQSNTTQLLVFGLHSIPRVDALSLTEATHLYSHLTDLAQFDFRSSPRLLHELGSWTNKISYHSARLQSEGHGRDLSTPARTSQPIVMYRSSSMSAGLNEVVLPEGSELAASIMLQRLVNHTPGAGDDVQALSELLALYRHLDMKAPVFCRSLILAMLHLVSLSNQAKPIDSVSPIGAFVLGRLPGLLARWESIAYEAVPAEEFRAALSSTLAFVLADRQLVASCSGRTSDALADASGALQWAPEDFRFAHHLVHALAKSGLLKDTAGHELDARGLGTLAPHFPTDSSELDKCAQNASDEGVMVEDYLASKLDSESADLGARCPLAMEVGTSYASHAAFVGFVRNSMTASQGADDLGQISALGRLLYSNVDLLAIVALHMPIETLIRAMVDSLLGFQYSTKSDSHTAVLQYGDILLLVQLCVHRYKLATPLRPSRLTRVARGSMPLSALSAEERSIAQRWMHSIFSPTSEGIDDDLQRNTDPVMLLTIAPTVFVEAFNAMAGEDANREVLLGGASFFVGDLLKWTLPSVLLALCGAIEREGALAETHLAALFKLVTSPKCPPPALQIAGFALLRLAAAPFVQTLATSAGKDIGEFRTAVCQALGAPSDLGLTPPAPNSTHTDVPRQIIHSILTAPPTSPFIIPFSILVACAPLPICHALLHEVSAHLAADRDGLLSISKSTGISIGAIMNAPRTGGSSISDSTPGLLAYFLKAFVPLVCARENVVAHGLPHAPHALDALAVLLGEGIRELKPRERAQQTVSTHLNRTESGSGAVSEAESLTHEFDVMLKGFVHSLEVAKVDSARGVLLQKIRTRKDYSSLFTFD